MKDLLKGFGIVLFGFLGFITYVGVCFIFNNGEPFQHTSLLSMFSFFTGIFVGWKVVD